MKRLVLIIAILISTSALAGRQSIAYGLKTDKGHCSATLVKVKNTCQMVTNAHCFDDRTKKIIVQSPAINLKENLEPLRLDSQDNLFDQFLSKDSDLRQHLWNFEKRFYGEPNLPNQETSIKFLDRSKDLAILAVPEPIQQGACRQLSELEVPRDDFILGPFTNFLIAGFTTNKTDKKPESKIWVPTDSRLIGSQEGTPHLGKTKKRFVTSSLKNVDQFLEVEGIDLLPGNSGGIAQTQNGVFIGIPTRYHPTQDTVYIIPSKDVKSYLLNPTNNNEAPTVENNTLPVGGNNSTDTTGDNNNFDSTGDNNNFDSDGSCLTFGSATYFTEALEGFIQQNGDVLLAVDGHQIDGSGDYKDHYQEAGRKTIRKRDGYPSREDRRLISARMKGTYQFDSHQKNYIRDRKHVIGWEKASRGEGKTKITIADGKLTLEFSGHNIKEDHSDFPARYHNSNGEKLEFIIEYQNDFKSIILRGKERVLKCDNRNYLKLICQDRGLRFSLSKDSEHPDAKASFRYSKAFPGVFQQYYYGNQK